MKYHATTNLYAHMNLVSQPAQAAAGPSTGKVAFTKKFLVLGYGAVASCFLDLLAAEVGINWRQGTIIDASDKHHELKDLRKRGVTFSNEKITRGNFAHVLSRYLEPGGLVIDVACGLGSLDLLTWCQANNVLYINTAVEQWQESHSEGSTIYQRYAAILEHKNQQRAGGTTAILGHGANPGLVSHWVKVALTRAASDRLSDIADDAARYSSLQNALRARDFAHICQLTDTNLIHIAEHDSQLTNRLRPPGEFWNTWSPLGFFEEATTPAEIAVGATGAGTTADQGERAANMACLNTPGYKTSCLSWVPSGEFTGMVIAHDELFTISHTLTRFQGANVLHRPSVLFVYRPSQDAIDSLSEHVQPTLTLPQCPRIIAGSIESGSDELGILLMAGEHRYWVGSVLSIHEARRQASRHNATTLQVAASLLAAVRFAILNSHAGICFPDDLPHEDILACAHKYIGPSLCLRLSSKHVDYTLPATPAKARSA